MKKITSVLCTAAMLVSAASLANSSYLVFTCPSYNSLKALTPVVTSKNITEPYAWEAASVYQDLNAAISTINVDKSHDPANDVTMPKITFAYATGSSPWPASWIYQTPTNQSVDKNIMVNEFTKILKNGYFEPPFQASYYANPEITTNGLIMDCRYHLQKDPNDKYLTNGGDAFVGFIFESTSKTKCEFTYDMPGPGVTCRKI